MYRTLEDILSNTPQVPMCSILVDGDIVAYRASAATDGRQYSIKGVKGVWGYKLDVVEYCKEQSISPELIQVEFLPEPIGHALNAVKTTMRTLEMSLSNHYDKFTLEVYLTDSSSNFRNDINPSYKANRKNIRRPFHLAACKAYLQKHYDASYPPYMEADDILCIRATEQYDKGLPYCIASIDKDLKQMHGDNYNWVNDEFITITKAQARENLWSQVVVGDNTDNVLVPAGIGPAKATKLFKGVDWDKVTDKWLEEKVAYLYSTFIAKNGKARKATGIPPNHDFTDVLCWVHETYNQVYLLRGMPC